jgi:hypothetical protein
MSRMGEPVAPKKCRLLYRGTDVPAENCDAGTKGCHTSHVISLDIQVSAPFAIQRKMSCTYLFSAPESLNYGPG